jgi:hypothetical protein
MEFKENHFAKEIILWGIRWGSPSKIALLSAVPQDMEVAY